MGQHPAHKWESLGISPAHRHFLPMEELWSDKWGRPPARVGSAASVRPDGCRDAYSVLGP